ncbi:MAG: exo-alpha-sialidase [Planctomycetota bacterium]
MLSLALSLLFIFQSQPAAAESRPAPPVELKPFGDDNVAQPRLAAVPTPASKIKRVEQSPPDKLHIVGQEGFDVVYTNTDDGGKSFVKKVILLKVKSGAAMRRGPRIAAFGKNIVVTASEGGDVTERRILSVCSDDAGVTWSQPTTVTDQAGAAAEGFHDTTVTSNGVFIVTWLDGRTGSGQSIYCSRSLDSGKTWTKNVKVYESPDGSVCECCPVSIAAGPKKTVAIAFRNKLNGARDLYVTSSMNDGESFNKPERIVGESWNLKACPMAEAAVCYWDEIGDLKNNPIFINNRDGELTFVLALRWAKLGRGRRPSIQFVDGLTYISFINEDQKLCLFYSNGNGLRMETIDAPDMMNADCPNIGVDENWNPWVVYQSKIGDKAVTRLLRMRSPFNK